MANPDTLKDSMPDDGSIPKKLVKSKAKKGKRVKKVKKSKAEKKAKKPKKTKKIKPLLNKTRFKRKKKEEIGEEEGK